jgi:soluble lytic murein transglycosylase-like protein
MIRRHRGFAAVDSLVVAVAALLTIVTVTAHGVPTPSPSLSPLPTPIVKSYARAGAQASGLDVALVLAVILSESAGDPRAVSGSGAVGLMQLEPATAAACGIADRYTAIDNVQCGSKVLRALVRRYGLPLGLAAYNDGAANVAKIGWHPMHFPRETRAYVSTVIATYDRYQHEMLFMSSSRDNK